MTTNYAQYQLMTLVSDDKDLAGTFTFSKAAHPKVSFDKISSSEYAACYYDSNWWAGLVQNVSCDEKDVEINFLHPVRPSNSFVWPKRNEYVKSDPQQY